MKVKTKTKLKINGEIYKPLETYKEDNDTHYRYYVEGWTILISQERNDDIVSMLITENDYSIEYIFSQNDLAPPKYQIACAIKMDELEETFNDLKEPKIWNNNFFR